VSFDIKTWFRELDEYLDEPFVAEGRQQPPMPPARTILDEGSASTPTPSSRE
jgi:hypothetical protein